MNLAPRELPDDPYVWHIEVLMALDCVLNAALGGWHHETLSSRAWRAWAMRRVFGRIFRPVIDVMFAWQRQPEGHCKAHHDAEVARADLIVKVRSTTCQPLTETA